MIKKIGAAALLASLLASTAMADSAGAPSEGKMNLKARLGYMNISGDKNFSGTNTNGAFSGTVSQKNGSVVELAANYFVTNNIALEGSLGYARTKVSYRSVQGNTTKESSSNNVGIVPLTALVQYHIMPEASVSPYIGVGYSYQFMTGGSNFMQFKNGGSAVGQVGVDIAFNDTMGFNIDVKHTLKAKHDIEKIQDVSMATKHKLSTTTVMVGVTFPF